jgi:sec-independent protein translocase protein TatA
MPSMPNLGPVELIIILVVVLLVFGVGRLSKIGGEMGSAIREFRKGIQGEEDEGSEKAEVETKSEDEPD